MLGNYETISRWWSISSATKENNGSSKHFIESAMRNRRDITFSICRKMFLEIPVLMFLFVRLRIFASCQIESGTICFFMVWGTVLLITSEFETKICVVGFFNEVFAGPRLVSLPTRFPWSRVSSLPCVPARPRLQERPKRLHKIGSSMEWMQSLKLFDNEGKKLVKTMLSFRKGEIIFTDAPYSTMVNKEHLSNVCNWCCAFGLEDALRCSICSKVVYCTTKCLVSWKEWEFVSIASFTEY